MELAWHTLPKTLVLRKVDPPCCRRAGADIIREFERRRLASCTQVVATHDESFSRDYGLRTKSTCLRPLQLCDYICDFAMRYAFTDLSGSGGWPLSERCFVSQ
jgi:hypothetical protein